MKALRYLLSIVLLMGLYSVSSAQENVVFSENDSKASLPIDLIDSIQVPSPYVFHVYLHSNDNPLTIHADSALFQQTLPDTLFITYERNQVKVKNPHLERIHVETTKKNIYVTSSGKQPFICVASGECGNGRLVIDSDTTCTLVLAGLNLVSQDGSAIYFRRKQKVTIELCEGTINALADASKYQLADTTDISNAALYSRGSLSLCGEGTLSVQGNYRYGIFSSKNITIESGKVNITNAVKDGIHCDHYKQKGGLVNLHLTQPAAKGIKAKKELELKGGTIEGEATGDLTIKDGETSYCSLVKSDGTFKMSGGSISLKHRGCGGRCISVDSTMTITGGTLNLKCLGDGGQYLTAANDSDYYTPKCITVNGSSRIERGLLKLLATGSGGKGLDCSDTLFIGRKGDNFLSADSLLIKVETQGWTLEDNIDEDYRRGCPKAIKSDSDINIYSGTLRLNTYGQGGEGIETKQSLRAYKATIIADCYDDGINTGQRCYIDGAHVFCRSHNNDGIDSNGKMTVMDGIVAAISEHYENECFDTEGTSLNIYGGYVIGVGNDEVKVSSQTSLPYYSTPSWRLRYGYQCGDSIAIQSGHYLTISIDRKAIVALRHENSSPDAFITVASVDMENNKIYQISDGDKPLNPSAVWLDENVVIGGTIKEEQRPLFNFKTY